MNEQLYKLINFNEKINIVDIGASPLLDNVNKHKKKGEPEFSSYQSLMNSNYFNLICVEGHEPAYNDLKKLNYNNSEFLNYVVGDGSEKTFNICKGEDMSSLLMPSKKSMETFSIYKKRAEILDRKKVKTKKLDNIDEIQNVDFLQMDVQGSELEIIKNGINKLSKVLFIETEISFVNLYENEPTFGEMDTELRKFGLIPHCLTKNHISKNIISPMVLNNDPFKNLNQIVQTNMVYVKDFRYLEKLSNIEIKKICIVAHYCYKSWDLAFRCIMSLIERKILETKVIDEYRNILKNENLERNI